MKNLLKTCLTVVLAFSMLLAFTTVSFAATGDVRTSNVVFTGNSSEISAQVFVRNSGEKKDATLIVAVYDGNNLSDVVTAIGGNKILSAGPINAKGKTLKAFVWENSNKKVISEVATYDGTDIFKNIKITVDGVDFADYVDEASVDFSVSSDYTKTFNIGEAQLPKDIKVTGDNGITATVVTDTDAVNPKTTITVGYGLSEQTSTSEPVKYWAGRDNTTHLFANEIASKRVYTITYNEAKNSSVIYSSDITPTYSPVTQAGQYKWLYKKTFTGGTGAAPKLVEVDLNKQQGRGAVIVVQPKDGSASSTEFTDIIVNEDGSAFTTLNDVGGKRYITEEGKVAYEEGTVPQKKGPISVTVSDSVDTKNYYVSSNFHSYNGAWTGSKPGYNQNPGAGNQMCIEDRGIVGDESNAFTGEYAPLTGGQYIALAWSAKSVGKVSFYVNQDVDVYVLDSDQSRGSTDRISTLSDADGWTYTTITNPTAYETYMDGYNFRILYQDSEGATKTKEVHSPLAIAYAINNGTLTENEAKYVYYETSNTVNVWRIHGHDLARKVSDVQFSNSNGYFDIDVLDNKELFRWWADDTLLADYSGKFSSAESGYTLSSTIADFKLADGINLPNDKGVNSSNAFDVRIFDVTPGVTNSQNKTETPDSYGRFSVYSDRNNGVGVLKQYSPVLGIKGAECIVHAINLSNGNVTEWNTESKEYASFKVTQDAEVMVFSVSGYYADIATAKGETAWTKISNIGDGLMAYTDADVGYSNLSVKEYSANSEVKIYSPGKYNRYIVVVKPIN